jgi:energy-coupling factor transporter transmembrane protein EcfT
MHPSLKIISLCWLAVLMQHLHGLQLLVLAVFMLLALLYFKARRYCKMLWRMRYLMLTILAIYALNTPGEYWLNDFAGIGITYEGLQQAGLQIARLALMLAGVALLLASTNRENLMTGFYVLLSPARYLGLNPERFAARLWLTLHYVESQSAKIPAQDWRTHLSQVHESNTDAQDEIILQLPHWQIGDAVIIVILPVLTWVLW